MPLGAVRRQFTSILDSEWQGVLGRTWNSKRPLIFDHVVLTNSFGVRGTRKIRAWITRRIDLCDRGLQLGLVGDVRSEEAAREGRSANGG